jgi:hypothetical protein
MLAGMTFEERLAYLAAKDEAAVPIPETREERTKREEEEDQNRSWEDFYNINWEDPKTIPWKKEYWTRTWEIGKKMNYPSRRKLLRLIVVNNIVLLFVGIIFTTFDAFLNAFYDWYFKDRPFVFTLDRILSRVPRVFGARTPKDPPAGS